jgi:hypothetical protein
VNTGHRRLALGALLAAPLGLIALLTPVAAGAAKGKASSLAESVDELDSRRQITDVLFRYARGWDRLDEEALRSCFFPDSKHQHGAFAGSSTDFITKGFAYISTIKGTTHAISNATIEIDGDRALSECYFAAHHRRMNKAATDEEDYYLSGRYLDRFERRDGVWKIAYRRGLNDTERVMPRADPVLSTAPADQLSGRKPNDPLYAMLADFHAGR